jgi:CheY-like chemotaxis protein
MINNSVLKTLTLLYVEDEGHIREMVSRFLRRRVAKVYEAVNGKEGLDIYTQNKDEIDLVITDIQMPIMNGMIMIDNILKINAVQPIIITTAYNDEQHTSDSVCKNLIKPINVEQLLEYIMYCTGVN